jgi:hypothetical protein
MENVGTFSYDECGAERITSLFCIVLEHFFLVIPHLMGNLLARDMYWAFPCPWARSGYIARPPVRTYGTPAQLLRRSLACASLRHTVVTIPNAICLYKTTTNIQICSRSLKTFQRNSDYLNIFRIWLKFCHR